MMCILTPVVQLGDLFVLCSCLQEHLRRRAFHPMRSQHYAGYQQRKTQARQSRLAPARLADERSNVKLHFRQAAGDRTAIEKHYF